MAAHEVMIRFAPKDDDEAQRIFKAVEALGFEITDALEHHPPPRGLADCVLIW